MSEVAERLLHIMDTLFFRDSKKSSGDIVPCYLIIRAIKSIKDDNLLELFKKDLESGIFQRLTYPFYIDLEQHKLTILGYSEKNQEFKISVLKYEYEAQQEKTMKHIDKRQTTLNPSQFIPNALRARHYFDQFTDNQLKLFKDTVVSYDPQGMREALGKSVESCAERIACTMHVLYKKNLDAVFSSLVEFFYAVRVAVKDMTDEELIEFSTGPFGYVCGDLKDESVFNEFKSAYLSIDSDGKYKLSIYDQANLYINSSELSLGRGPHPWFALSVALNTRAIAASKRSPKFSDLDIMELVNDGDAAIKIAEEIVDSFPEHNPQYV